MGTALKPIPAPYQSFLSKGWQNIVDNGQQSRTPDQGSRQRSLCVHRSPLGHQRRACVCVCVCVCVCNYVVCIGDGGSWGGGDKEDVCQQGTTIILERVLLGHTDKLKNKIKKHSKQSRVLSAELPREDKQRQIIHVCIPLFSYRLNDLASTLSRRGG